MPQSSPHDKPIAQSASGVTGRVSQSETKHDLPTPESELSIEYLAEEFMARHRKGESPSVDEYINDYPDYADEIRTLFPAIAVLEGFKHFEGPDGKVSLGSSQPRQLGDFRIIREVGRGGMGVVYEAIQESLNRQVAVKVLPRHSMLEGKELKRFRREAEISASLHHTNIVPVFGVGENEGFHYYVMQFNDGLGLDEVLQRIAQDVDRVRPETADRSDFISEHRPELVAGQSLRLPDDSGRVRQFQGESGYSDDIKWNRLVDFVTDPRKVAHLGIQAARALQYAHDRGVLHRDIKPGNLLLDNEGFLQVTDFGLARAVERENISTTGEIVGTLAYMSPEMLDGETTARSDIYSLGITLYEILTRQSAVDRTNRSIMIQQIKQGTIAPPRRWNPSISLDLETIILKAIAVEPKHRYSTADQLADDLQRYLDDRPIDARRVSPVERLYRWSRRNPTVASLSSLALFLLVLVGVTAVIGYRAELEQRRRAQASAALAADAIDRVFDRFVPQRIRSTSDVAFSGFADTGEQFAQPILSHQSADILEGMIQFYEQLAESTGDKTEYRIKTAEAYRKVGKIHQRLGATDSALTAYKNALGVYQNIISENTIDISRDEKLKVAAIFNEIGQLCRLLGQEQESNSAHYHALDILLKLLKTDRRSAATRFELARTYYLMARELPLEMKQKFSPGGPARLIEGPPLHSPVISAKQASSPELNHAVDKFPLDAAVPSHPQPQPETQVVTAPTGNRPLIAPNVEEALLAHQNTRHKFNRPGASLSHGDPGRPFGASVLPREPSPLQRDQLEKAIAILEELLEKFRNEPEYRYLLALCLHETVPATFTKSETDQAIEDRVFAILNRLVEDYPHVSDYQQALVVAYGRIDIRFEHVPMPEEASDEIVARFRKAISRADKLVTAHPAVPAFKISLIHLHHKLAHILDDISRESNSRKTRQLRDASEISRRTAFRLQQELVDQFPESSIHRNWLTRFQIALARLLIQKGSLYEAKNLLVTAVEQLQNDIAESPGNAGTYHELREATVELAHLYEREGDTDKMKSTWQQVDEYEDIIHGNSRDQRPHPVAP